MPVHLVVLTLDVVDGVCPGHFFRVDLENCKYRFVI
jgi:hypothetical protein